MKENCFVALSPNVDKKLIKKGKFGRKPSLGWVCKIALFPEGSEVPENIEITIGNGCTVKDRMIEFCLESMHQEEESSFLLKFDKDNLCFRCKIVLLEFKEKPYIFQWTDEEKLEASNFYKSIGAELFKENKIEEAFYKFSIALKLTLLLDSVLESDEPVESVTNLRIALYNNLAGCHLHFKNYLKVIKLCNDSLELQATTKAYYRRALANIELKEYDKAEMDLVHLLKIEPKNKAGIEKYKLVRELDRSNRENYEAIVRKMFQ